MVVTVSLGGFEADQIEKIEKYSQKIVRIACVYVRRLYLCIVVCGRICDR